MNQIKILKIEYTFGEKPNWIYPVLLKDAQELILVDCGYPGFLPNIKEAAMHEQIDLSDLTKIIITHHDYDHMGALAAFKREYPRVEILASEEQLPYINGSKKSLRLQQAEAIYDSLPESQKEGARFIQQRFASVENVDVDAMLKSHDNFLWCGGIEIVPTPGHMPGHISIYLKEFKTLIAGDALAVQNGELEIANPEYTLDMKTAKGSIKSLLNYDIEKIVCYHGGLFDGDVKSALERI